MRSARRGGRWDPVTSRPYRPGDDLRLIDHRASAKLSAARASDELIVREHYAEEAAGVVLAVAGHASMSLYPEGLPWLHKPRAVDTVAELVTASASRSRSRVDRLEPESLPALLRQLGAAPGTFVFVISDFLEPVPERVWTELLARRLDLVPVVLQDPVWERSFPAVAGVVLPASLPHRCGARPVRLTRAEAEALRATHETRHTSLLESLTRVGLEPVVLDENDPDVIFERFVCWSEGRRRGSAWAA
jgi:uncharacterized protein (DUF58 family)